MKSKYEESAKKLLESNSMFDGYCSEFHVDTVPDFIIEEMCQLAEEVEKETKAIYVDFIKHMTNGMLFTRERVEELLEKQRELSAEQTLTNREDILNTKLKID